MIFAVDWAVDVKNPESPRHKPSSTPRHKPISTPRHKPISTGAAEGPMSACVTYFKQRLQGYPPYGRKGRPEVDAWSESPSLYSLTVGGNPVEVSKGCAELPYPFDFQLPQICCCCCCYVVYDVRRLVADGIRGFHFTWTSFVIRLTL